MFKAIVQSSVAIDRSFVCSIGLRMAQGLLAIGPQSKNIWTYMHVSLVKESQGNLAYLNMFVQLSGRVYEKRGETAA